ncbi:Tartrate-resistant acid phosphatase type 5 [Aphelenchoides fujianensis]|nr:Tartrate-resistant acid phosphatase type 5 [Aphelenchoides fujianensis]
MELDVRWRQAAAAIYRIGLFFAVCIQLSAIDAALPAAPAVASDARTLTPRDRLACTDGRVCHLDKDFLDFFVIGDTGGLALDLGGEYLNFIKATEVQERLAKSMLAGRQRPEFIIDTGDNVYFNGVDNVFDSRFETVFEEVYSHDNLLVPFFMIAGNHDHLGNISAQIEYTKYSSRWTFPKLYYKLSYSFARGTRTVDIVFIDTIVLCGNSIDVGGRSVFSWLLARRRVPNRPDPQWADEAERQWKWVEQQLSDSTADYLFVVGHYPIYSISSHGNVQCLIDRLDPLLRRFQVSAYISGHDHNIQFFRIDDTNSPQSEIRTYGTSNTHKHKETFLGRPNYYRKGVSTMHYLVSGAGSRTDFSTDNADRVPAEPVFHYPKKHDVPAWKRLLHAPELGYGWGGFVRFEVRNDSADLYFYTGDLNLQFLDYINRRPSIAEFKDRRRKTRKKSLA